MDLYYGPIYVEEFKKEDKNSGKITFTIGDIG